MNEDVVVLLLSYLDAADIKRCSRISRVFRSASCFSWLWREYAIRDFGLCPEMGGVDICKRPDCVAHIPNWYRYYQSVVGSPFKDFIRVQRVYQLFVRDIISHGSTLPYEEIVRLFQQSMSDENVSSRLGFTNELRQLSPTSFNEKALRSIRPSVVFVLQIGDFGDEYLWSMDVIRQTPYSVFLRSRRSVDLLPDDWQVVKPHIDSLTIWAIGVERNVDGAGTELNRDLGCLMVYRQENPYSDPREPQYVSGWDFFTSELSKFGGVDVSLDGTAENPEICIRIPVAISTIVSAVMDRMYNNSGRTTNRAQTPINDASRHFPGAFNTPLSRFAQDPNIPVFMAAGRLPIQLHLELYNYSYVDGQWEKPSCGILQSWGQIHTHLIPEKYTHRYKKSNRWSGAPTRSPRRSSVPSRMIDMNCQILTLEGALGSQPITVPANIYNSGLGVSMWVTDASGRTLFGVPFCQPAKLVKTGGNSVVYCEAHLYDVRVPKVKLSVTKKHYNLLTMHIKPPIEGDDDSSAIIKMIRLTLDPTDIAAVAKGDSWLFYYDPTFC